MAKHRELCFETYLTFGAALNARRTSGAVDHGVERNEALGAVRSVDDARRDFPAAVPRPQSRSRRARFSLGFSEWHPRCPVELSEHVQFGLPPGQPGIPVVCHFETTVLSAVDTITNRVLTG